MLRVAVYFDRALFTAWPFALAAAAVRVLWKRKAWPIAIGYLLAILVLALGYPALRFAALRKAYFAIELVALAVGVSALLNWHLRTRGERQRADVATRCAGVLVAGHLMMVVVGPYRFGLFGEAWAHAHIAYAAILGAVVVLQLVEVLGRADA